MMVCNSWDMAGRSRRHGARLRSIAGGGRYHGPRPRPFLLQITMSNRALPLLIIAVLAAAGGLWAAQGLFGSNTTGTHASPLPPVSRITLLQTTRLLPQFSLQHTDGPASTGEALHGHWTLVFMGVTHSPNVSPTT